MLNNIRGFKTKETMLKRIVAEEEPVLLAICETKLNKNDKVAVPGYEIVRVDRDEGGGGVMLLYKQCLRKILLSTAEIKLHNAEILWCKLKNGKINLKIGVIYMPQESRTRVNKLKEIYETIEAEVADAQQKGESVLIMGDLNCKVGEAIEGNSGEVSKGGKLLLKMMKRFKLKMVNAEECCQGLWTRVEGTCKSILDYVIVFEEDIHLIQKMVIDEGLDQTPYYVEKEGGNEVRQYTDHYMIEARMNINYLQEKSQTYTMIIDENGYERFRDELKRNEVSKLLDDEDIRKSYPVWSAEVMKIKESCSKKVKIKKRWKVNRKLTAAKKRITRELKKKLSNKQVKELKERRNFLSKCIEEEEQIKERTRINKIVEEVKKGGGINSNVFWEVRRKLCGRTEDKAHAMINNKGQLCDKPEEIKAIHADWFKELLTTRKGETKIERQAEEIVEMVWKSMEVIAEKQPPRVTTREEVAEIVKKLDPKKAKDAATWKNSLIKEGGEEMITSLTKITNMVDSQRVIPNEWQKMEIKATHKTGARYNMSNKRGLFLTNNISKIYERVIKERNQDSFTESITVWQTGGVRERAGVDNVMTTTAILEQNKYQKKNTYIVFTDAEKCFDKLWLKDGISELWRCGTDVRDCVMIKKLNEKAEIVVKTPVGNTEPFWLEDIVRQGSVYGPQICISSMDKINELGKDIKTYYSPDLAIQAVVFVDDVTGAGGINTINNTIFNCSLMEERKKMTFNNKRGKTEYMVVGKFNEEIRTLSKTVKKGTISRVEEHKMLGTWIDETGDYGINTMKKKEKLPFMISTVKKQASPKSIGIYSVEGRLKLAEAVIIKSILYNAEGFPSHTDAEIKELESVQLNILTSLLELPRSTPYCALLMEVGWWTMKARITYTKLMLYHNIKRSNDRRVIKQLVKAQEDEIRETTWLAGVKREIEKLGIALDVNNTLKSTWKREVKKRVNDEMEKELRNKCSMSKKARWVKDDVYERKQYLDGRVDLQTAKRILRTRMNMSKLPCNYKENGEGMCSLCEEGEGSTEHYFSCKRVSRLLQVWQVKMEDLKSQEITEMRNMANFFEKVEILLQPNMKKW